MAISALPDMASRTSSTFSDQLFPATLQWRHNESDGVSNHQPTIVYSRFYSGAIQSKHQSSASLAFVRGIHRWPVDSPHKGPVTRKMFPFDDVFMNITHKTCMWLCWVLCGRGYIIMVDPLRDSFAHILPDCCTRTTGAIIRLPQCRWSSLEGNG